MEKIDFTSVGYHEALKEQKILASRCADCGNMQFPPRTICPKCWSADLDSIALSGRGELRSYTIVFIGLSQMIKAGYDRTNPYCAGYVALEEGPVVSAQILGLDVTHPEEIRIGTPLQAAFIERGEGAKQKTYLAFQP
jgi:uncharacterized OB-fold protein